VKTTVIFLLSLLLAQVVSAYDLAQHLWRERLLILIAPSTEDPGLQQQRRVAAARRDAVIDRDLRVLELAGEAGVRDGEPLDTTEVASLRARFAVGENTRLLILIGLDGGTKRRASLDTDLAEVFRQIDAMPMRRVDIRAKKAAGIPVTEP